MLNLQFLGLAQNNPMIRASAKEAKRSIYSIVTYRSSKRTAHVLSHKLPTSACNSNTEGAGNRQVDETVR